ncbi:MAG TPA: hypothetical protein VFC73_01905 [Syntrophomonadaceae bacterium]|nr:hypothetical protein [Syntrophomonadaceae bacterium]
MRTPFLIFIGSVFIITILFGVLIWLQLGRIQKKALIAKRKKEQFIRDREVELTDKHIIKQELTEEVVSNENS